MQVIYLLYKTLTKSKDTNIHKYYIEHSLYRFIVITYYQHRLHVLPELAIKENHLCYLIHYCIALQPLHRQ